MPLEHTAARLTIATPEFDRSLQFYCHLLGQEPATLLPNTYAEFPLPGTRLGIFRPKNLPLPRSPRSSAPLGMALCLEVKHLETAIDHLTTLGYPPLDNIMTASHGREIYAYDPDGNWLILHEAREV